MEDTKFKNNPIIKENYYHFFKNKYEYFFLSLIIPHAAKIQ